MRFLALLASIAGFASAASIAKLPTQNLRLPEGYGHYATFVVAESGFTFDLSAQGYNGTPKVIVVDQETSKMPSLPETNGPRFTPVRDSSDLEALARRDICARIAVCVGRAADGIYAGGIYIANTFGDRCSIIGNAVYNYFTENNYANMNAILQNFIVGLIVNIASTPIGDAIQNSQHFKAEGGPDSCSVTEREDLAIDFGGAIIQFCQAIQQAQTVDNAATRFQAGTLSNDATTIRGDNSVTKAFISAQSGNFGPICSQYGITWKRLNGYTDSLLD
ncbi:hypothetical protein LY76DRAFT_650808 [Colletotrichum caudatum]|nr:hypothetical protein LY76DRAFT_650808 [Colletotrichum caudatum]